MYIVHSLISHQFLIACSTQNRGGRPGSFYHVNDVSVYLGRQSGGGVIDWKNAFYTHVLQFEWGAVCFSLHERSKTPVLGAETTRYGFKFILQTLVSFTW